MAAASYHVGKKSWVKAKSTWKNVSLDGNRIPSGMMTGVLGLQELTDYEIIQEDHSNDFKKRKQSGDERKSFGKLTKKMKKKNKMSSKVSGEVVYSEEGENKSHQLKKRRRKKNKSKSEEKEDSEGERESPRKKNRREQAVPRQGSKVGNSRIISSSNVVYLHATKTKAFPEDNPNQNTENRSRKRKSDDINPAGSLKKKKQKDTGNEGAPKKCEDMTAWNNLFVPDAVLKGLSDLGFSAPTPIQTLVLPSAIRDRMDIIGAAETGSGKTLAFGIPLLHYILMYHQLEGEKKSGRKDNENEGNGSDTANNSDCEESEDSKDEDLQEYSSDEKEDSKDEDLQEYSPDEKEDEQIVLDMPAIAMQPNWKYEKQFADDECDLPPSDEDEEFEDLEDNEMGCVRVKNNVKFDWLEEAQPADSSGDPSHPLLALILTPTRELAMQVNNHIKAVAKYTDIKTVVVVGGMAAQKQERLLRRCPEIVVATPGRLWEMIQEGDPHLSKVEDIRYLVIDEADRMVQKGHFEELSRLLEKINSNEEKRNKRQNLIFSATLTMVHSGPNRYIKKKKEKMTSKQKLEALMSQIGISEKPKIVDLTKKEITAETLTEARIICTVEEKDMYLYYFLHRYPARTLVFCNSKDCVRRLVTVFSLLQCCPLPLHADMHQNQRLKNLDRFKGNPRGLLLATDVAARGLDIPDVQHVIHYQVPRTTENYVHRSGRTARALKEGLSVMLIGPEDQQYYKRIVKTLNRDDHLPVFPTEVDYLAGIKPRVALARQVDKEEHKVIRQKIRNNWFEKAAREMEIELEESQLENLGTDREQAQHKRKIQAWKSELKSLLQSPILSRQFSGKYPTKFGKLELPFNTERLPGGAVDSLKVSKRKEKPRDYVRNRKKKH